MKSPLSHELAVAIAEIAHKFPRLVYLALAFVIAFAAAAVIWDIWWLWILAALTVSDTVALFLGKGIDGILSADPKDVADLRRKWAWPDGKGGR